MQMTTNAKMGLPDIIIITTLVNNFPEGLDRSLGWKLIEQVLQAMYSVAKRLRPCAPLAIF
jgi:hypothetical protein